MARGFYGTPALHRRVQTRTTGAPDWTPRDTFSSPLIRRPTRKHHEDTNSSRGGLAALRRIQGDDSPPLRLSLCQSISLSQRFS